MKPSKIAILPVLLVLAFAGILFWNYYQNNNDAYLSPGFSLTDSYENESQYPDRYINITEVQLDQRALKRDKVTGIIQSKAKRARYSRINLQLKWYDKNNQVIKVKQSELDIILNPGDVKNFAIFQDVPLLGVRYTVEVEHVKVYKSY